MGVDYLYSDECEHWWLHEVPDVWCLPDYKLNSAETKRNISPFHTYKQHSDYMASLTNSYEGRCKIYFDVSQL